MKHFKLDIALLQFSLFWERPKENIAFFRDQITAIGTLKDKPDLVILPEMWSTGFSMALQSSAEHMGKLSLSFMIEMAQLTKMAIAGSTIYKDGNKVYNRFFFVYPEGHYEYYDKRHTFSLAGETAVYEKGNALLIIHYKGFKICPLICYDLRFPVWSRNTQEYDLLLYVANWPAPRIHAWDTLLKARAIENMAYCVGLNRMGVDPNGHCYPGHSAVYDAFGKTIIFSTQEGAHRISLDLESLNTARKQFPFLADKDSFKLNY